MLVGTLLLVAVVAAALVFRARATARFDAEVRSQHPVGADGIIVGAGPIELPRAGAPAVLLLHGAGDTPQTLTYLAEYLYARGYAVRAPLLAGHGRTVRDFSHVSAGEWMHQVRAAFDDLRSDHGWVAAVGISMGGALAAQLAAERPEMPALVLVAPYFVIPPLIRVAARLAPLWGLVVPVVRAGGSDSIRDPAEASKNLAYGVFTARALRALHDTVRRGVQSLPRIAVPTLVVQSKDDNRIAPADAQWAFDRLGTPEKQLEWVEGGAHVITVDYGREHVLEVTADWLDSHRSLVSA
jgi:carboxylesterase